MSSFAALRRSTKKPAPASTKDVPAPEPVVSAEELDQAIFQNHATGVSNWADDSEDDDDVQPAEELQPGWIKAAGAGRGPSRTVSKALPVIDNVIHDDLGDDEEAVDLEAELGVELVDDEEEEHAEDEQEHEPEAPRKPSTSAPPVPKPAPEAEKQLSKKELKKKEMEELDAVFAEFGIAAPQPAAAAGSAPAQQAKKKKSKAKAEGEAAAGPADSSTAPAPAPAPETNGGAHEEEEEEEEAGGTIDPAAAKARLLAAAKKADNKKKSVSAVALAEAKARKAKLNKQKDTKAFNQMPSR